MTAAVVVQVRGWPVVWAKSSSPKPVYNQVLDVSCNLLDTVLEVKSRMAVGVPNGHLCIIVSPVVTRLTGSCPAQHHERGSDHTALPRKEQISTSKVSCYCSHSIVSRGLSAPRSPCGYDGTPVPIKGKQGGSCGMGMGHLAGATAVSSSMPKVSEDQGDAAVAGAS